MFWNKKPQQPQQDLPAPQGKLPMCEDCAWFRPYCRPDRLDLSKCGNPETQDSGATLVARHGGTDALAFCCNARGTDRQCGKKGKYFQPKPNPPAPPVVPPYRGVLDNIDCSLLRIAKRLEEMPLDRKAKK